MKVFKDFLTTLAPHAFTLQKYDLIYNNFRLYEPLKGMFMSIGADA